MKRSEDEVQKDIVKLQRYLNKPRTMAEIMDRFSVNRRTVYRWFEGLNVARVGIARPTRYKINEAA